MPKEQIACDNLVSFASYPALVNYDVFSINTEYLIKKTYIQLEDLCHNVKKEKNQARMCAPQDHREDGTHCQNNNHLKVDPKLSM